MKLPLAYVARNLWVRRLTTVLTAGGMALVVFVFAAVLMLDAGLRATLVATGSDLNVLFIRKGAQTEVQSGVARDQAALIESLPQVARDAEGRPRVSKEVVVLNSLTKVDTGRRSNVPVRGVTPMGLQLRPHVKVVDGRLFRPGSSEIIVGAAVARQFAGVQVGQSLSFAQRQWTVVGVFDAGRTAFDSEIWGDAEQLAQAFRRFGGYSSVIARLASYDDFDPLQAAVAGDPRLTVEVKRERQFYEDQSRALSNFISYLGVTLSVIFSLGAIIGATITMYSSVATRTGEIGTLRALGFRRRAVLAAFLLEALLLALAGGIVGLVAATFLQAITISTTNFQSFSELAFSFTLTPKIAAISLAFALAMGVAGGFLPAVRASRMKIVDALRAD
ncbi:MAG: ABC transporter permease [Burkholderiales bacterium]|nr:MAG: ABC transporter permease [Burkholderiales bacterium]